MTKPYPFDQIIDQIPDARDGLTRTERIILTCLNELQKEFGGRSVPSITLYGRVVEQIDISEQALQQILRKHGAER